MTDPSELIFNLPSDLLDLKLYVDDINFSKSKDEIWTLQYGYGRLLIKEKQ